MANKTEGVKFLVENVLLSIYIPYEEDIILNVFQKIDRNRDWYKRYVELGEELTTPVVNNWIGKYTKNLTGMKTLRHVHLKGNQLITSYTKLTS